AQREIETARYLSERSDLRIVNAAEPVRLHHSVPHAPDKRNEHNSLQVPHGKSRADDDQENRRTNETPSETLKQRAIAIGANHSRQMMTHRAKRSDEKINVLRAPEPLRRDENRHQ